MEYERERKELPEDEWVGIVEDTADTGGGLSVLDQGRPNRGTGFAWQFGGRRLTKGLGQRALLRGAFRRPALGRSSGVAATD